MKIVDGHEDIAWNGLALGRDVLRSAWETRRIEIETENPLRNGQCMLGLPEWLEGGVALVLGSLFATPARRAMGSWDREVYADAEEAHLRYAAQLDYYHRLADRSSQITVVGSWEDVERVLSSWEGDTPQVGILPSMEGADGIRRPSEVEWWYRRGVRIVGLAWAAGSRYAGGNSAPGPLTGEGRDLLAAMAEVGMILDLSHLSDESFWEAVDRYEGPVIATHANPRALVPGRRQLSDQMIRAIAERGGVIGVVLFNAFLKHGWHSSDGKEEVTLQHVVAAIDHICQVVGDAAHVGIGSDFDGGFGGESVPAGVETVADLPQIAISLREFGYTDLDIEAILGENWLHLFHTSLQSPNHPVT